MLDFLSSWQVFSTGSEVREGVFRRAGLLVLDQGSAFPTQRTRRSGPCHVVLSFHLTVPQTISREMFRCAFGAENPIPRRYARTDARYRTALLCILGGVVAGGLWLVSPNTLWIGPCSSWMYFALASTPGCGRNWQSPMHDLHFHRAETIMTRSASNNRFGQPDRLPLFWFNRAYRTHPMPHQLRDSNLLNNPHRVP